jgi:bifunctional DNase/RNase
MENIIPPRPLTHDLMKNLLDSVEARISRIVVSDLRENTYYAVVGVKLNGRNVEVDARPSDAIALALRSQAPIYVTDEVMRKASVSDKEAERGDERQPQDPLDRLNLDLQKAVEDERYEDAARLRDEINAFKRDRRGEN